ncbi:MAG TPA: type II secretion system F family protein [Microvirga sp.]|jgi:tight adherence protein C|nr:type II secretion system F family protein [Microvirga sp.]
MIALLPNPNLVLALSAALSVFCALMVVSWPYLARNPLDERLRQVAVERERIRVRERGRMDAKARRQLALRNEPRKLYAEIVRRFKLASGDDGELAQTLRMAGYRGPGPVTTYLAAQVLCAFALFAFSGLYVFVILKMNHPLALKLGITFAAAYLGYYAPRLYIKNKITKRQQSVRRAWPDSLDLLLICVESGMSVEGALRKVSEEIGVQSVELAEELTLTTAELAYLQDRRKAFENLGERTGLDGVKSVVTSLIQSEKYGTPLGQSLRVLAQENRDTRMSAAEKKAAELPPKLTVPMILFFLPVLFAVIITPAAIRIAAL